MLYVDVRKKSPERTAPVVFCFLVWDIRDKDRHPPRATIKHGSIYDYYDIMEEIGR